MLVAQIVTGVVLAMHYTPQSSLAFASIEHIMRDVNYGWLLRYAHANGASMFFLALYIHMFRACITALTRTRGSLVAAWSHHLSPGDRDAFMGYVLPWGQMSFWGATVITACSRRFPSSAIRSRPVGVATRSITRPSTASFAPLSPAVHDRGVVVLHVWALHVHGSNNPAGIEKKTTKDTLHSILFT